MTFNWNIDNWLNQYLPPFKKQLNRVKWLRALLKPIKTLHTSLLTYRSEINRKARINGQTIVLENYLNDLFDSSDRRIYIETTSDLNLPVYSYLKSEGKPVFFYTAAESKPVYFRSSTEIPSSYQFEVVIPVGVLTSAEEVRLKGIVNYYRLAGCKPLFKRSDNTLF